MGIHLSGGGAKLRRIVLSCDVAGCAVQVEPPAAERWRSDKDARTWAREHAAGWTHDPVRQTDYCPEHAAFSAPPATDLTPPRPTASVRDGEGNPLNRDEYAARLRAQLSAGDGAAEPPSPVTAAQLKVAALLLNELAGVYRGDHLGALARDLAALFRRRAGQED